MLLHKILLLLYKMLQLETPSTGASESAGSQNNEIKSKIIEILKDGNVTTPYCLLLDAAKNINHQRQVVEQKK